MSTEEQMAATGRIVTEYRDTKARLAALVHEAERVGRILDSLGQCFRQGAGGPVVVQYIQSLPAQQALLSLAEDLDRETRRKYSLELQLKELGLS